MSTLLDEDDIKSMSDASIEREMKRLLALKHDCDISLRRLSIEKGIRAGRPNPEVIDDTHN